MEMIRRLIDSLSFTRLHMLLFCPKLSLIAIHERDHALFIFFSSVFELNDNHYLLDPTTLHYLLKLYCQIGFFFNRNRDPTRGMYL